MHRLKKQDAYLFGKKIESKVFTNQSDQIIYCLGKYKNERLISLAFGAVGAGIAVYGSSQITSDYHYGFAGAFGLIGLIVYFDADKWLSKKKLTFTGNTISYRF